MTMIDKINYCKVVDRYYTVADNGERFYSNDINIILDDKVNSHFKQYQVKHNGQYMVIDNQQVVKTSSDLKECVEFMKQNEEVYIQDTLF